MSIRLTNSFGPGFHGLELAKVYMCGETYGSDIVYVCASDVLERCRQLAMIARPGTQMSILGDRKDGYGDWDYVTEGGYLGS